MSMNRGRFLLAAAAVVTALGLAPTTAQAAAPAPVGAEAGATVQAADGQLYAWEHSWKGGRQATWVNSSSDWADRNMRNQASSVHNNGYAGAYEDVRLYWGVGHTGASYCLGNGNYLMDMRYDRFPYNGTEGGEVMNDNVASHRWGNYC
ncbi:hypothetical protein ABZX62_11015 [Streptomyces flavidovirens]|uniref:hypothetical protein n=1 Tax=Streptomyces flavidovirens TaxID=67298 RepID=UPI00339DB3BD